MKEKIHKEPITLGLNGKPFSITLIKKPVDTTLKDNFIDTRLDYLSIKTTEKVFSIFYKGNMIKTYGGKTSWSATGYARLALNNIFNIRQSEFIKIGFTDRKDFINYLIGSGIVEIKQIN